MANATQDVYDAVDIDDRQHQEMDALTRQLVETKLRKREREEARRQGLYVESSEMSEVVGVERRRRVIDDGLIQEVGEEDEEVVVQGKLSEWVKGAGARGVIGRKFKGFLTGLVDGQGKSVFGPLIARIGEGIFF